MSESKPREWWIDPTDELEQDAMDCPPVFMALQEHPGQGPLQWQSSLIQVIERSAYDELMAEAMKLRTALEEAAEAYEAIDAFDQFIARQK